MEKALALVEEVVRYKGASSSVPAQFRHLPPCEEEAAHIQQAATQSLQVLHLLA